jgi:hypothetical protein
VPIVLGAKKKIIYGQQIDVSIAMIRLFGGEVLDDPSQDFNITSGSDIQILSTLHVPFGNIYNLYMANSLILPLTTS